MAQIAKTKKLIVLLQQNGSPTTWEAPCSINTNREFTIEAAVSEVPEVDCDDPDAPSWVARAVETLSAGLSGAGTLDTPDFEQWRDWMLSAEEKEIRIKLDVPLADGGGWFQGPFLITSLGLGKEGKGFTTFSCELQSAGEITWTDANS
jgi:hypothetical protein